MNIKNTNDSNFSFMSDKKWQQEKENSNFNLNINSAIIGVPINGIIIEMSDNTGYININGEERCIDDYENKKNQVIDYISNKAINELITVEKNLCNLIAIYDIYEGGCNCIILKLNNKEYDLNFSTYISEKEMQFFHSFLDSILKILNVSYTG